ncbi:hypothetical protein AGLY_011704 [Aphis glycines]|uniref:Uncharacterized protein n=1 Tax=Aphis glycines TaxID=307491 RepID=A0A6G0TBV7_APHGL|nr:hypothetical protein AGLY_011704 [Aphis glycines]
MQMLNIKKFLGVYVEKWGCHLDQNYQNNSNFKLDEYNLINHNINTANISAISEYSLAIPSKNAAVERIFQPLYVKQKNRVLVETNHSNQFISIQMKIEQFFVHYIKKHTEIYLNNDIDRPDIDKNKIPIIQYNKDKRHIAIKSSTKQSSTSPGFKNNSPNEYFIKFPISEKSFLYSLTNPKLWT